MGEREGRDGWVACVLGVESLEADEVLGGIRSNCCIGREGKEERVRDIDACRNQLETGLLGGVPSIDRGLCKTESREAGRGAIVFPRNVGRLTTDKAKGSSRRGEKDLGEGGRGESQGNDGG